MVHERAHARTKLKWWHWQKTTTSWLAWSYCNKPHPPARTHRAHRTKWGMSRYIIGSQKRVVPCRFNMHTYFTAHRHWFSHHKLSHYRVICSFVWSIRCSWRVILIKPFTYLTRLCMHALTLVHSHTHSLRAQSSHSVQLKTCWCMSNCW